MAAESGARALPRPGSLRAWVLAARPKTLVAGWAPVLVGTSIAYAHGSFRPLRALGALVVAVAIQVGTNLVNDAADFARGADSAHRVGPPRAVACGLLPGRLVMRWGMACFALAAGVGGWLAAVSGWWLLVPGGLAILAGIGYTAGPKPLAYAGLGEPFVFVFFGLVAVLGTLAVQGRGPDAPSVSYAAAVGFLSVAILEVNNIRDLPTDAASGKRTLAVRLGDRRARVLFAGCIASAYAAALVAMPFLGWPLVGLLPLLSVPHSVAVVREVGSGTRGASLNATLGKVAVLQAEFALLAAAAFLVLGASLGEPVGVSGG